MIYVVIAYLWAAILLYILLGGADFGAGIIELFTSSKNKQYTRTTMYQAIGPVWEANHMWLIIAIVVLFVGFPEIYTTISTHLHIPLVIMLFGIIARGTAFTFRHYDAVVDNMQKVYNKIFVYSSFVTPFFLGVIAASAVSGRIDTGAGDFLSAYIFSWLNWFSITVGFFTVAICGYLAAIFIIGETKDNNSRIRFIRKAKQMNLAAVVFGALVFWAAHSEDIPLDEWLFGNAVGVIALIAALLSLVLLWYLLLKKGKVYIIRVLAGFQVTMILLAITLRHYPNIVILKGGQYLSLMEHAGQEKTIWSLAVALLLGSIFILPALFYLIYSFQKNKGQWH
ncbi:cytochrome d ubiquinol oxidase subunit II [Chitinophaga ginsengisoli]|uniref:Cytochrome bd-I ubiquinol oxidase subunit 2 apoprotein n=1 Tax=Chitinophaga ginsengisoli TaxID=363837 RepID=A0A2P8G2U0_9BACT|nr:cytochrome d ubiquinol oxidase subunit II [Chitinophaga ginsengisoli]PSL28291.1 cytochrome bd-I ubiquinol oxidase subunit 2 apoprotein [Chitinophaga ginsengisoli]